MKTDLNSLKKELSRLTDVDYLKKELNRIAGEIKKFDVHITLTPQAKETMTQLEKRFRDLLNRLSDLQKQVDSNLVKFKKIVTKTQNEAGKKIRVSMGLNKKKATSKKAASKKSGNKTTKKTSSKTAKTSGKKTTRKSGSKTAKSNGKKSAQ